MNATLANLLKAQIEGLNFIDKITGIVKPLLVKDSAGNEKVYPIAINTDDKPCKTADYTDLVPDSSKISIIYFEDEGIDVVNAGCRYVDCSASIKLVCWCNLKKINMDYTNANLLKAAIIQTIPRRLDNAGWATKILVSFDGEDTRSADIFSAYTYDESVTQYLMYPFDYFALNYKVQYSIPMDTSCINDVVMNPGVC